ncbi:MAG: GNAT family N-acetyltransferase [Acidobacteriaceae bacterium]
MNATDFNIRTAASSDRSRLANLIHFSAYIHQHLDWKPALDWIGQKPYNLMESNTSLLAALACPADLPDITWIRLFAVSSKLAVEIAWRRLWQAVLNELSMAGNMRISALSLQGWFNQLLEDSRFAHTDNVIVLLWDQTTPFPKPATGVTAIQSMQPENVNSIVGIDHAAFGLDWKNSLEALELAYQQSSYARVAVLDGEIVGYQYCTTSTMGGHLARLAVKPSAQGKGIGYLLVHDVLEHYKRQGAMHVTVNTQEKNSASLALYAKAGFRSTGESYRVYQYMIKD